LHEYETKHTELKEDKRVGSVLPVGY